jgi:hypothetical protein
MVEFWGIPAPGGAVIFNDCLVALFRSAFLKYFANFCHARRHEATKELKIKASFLNFVPLWSGNYRIR